MKPGRSWTLSLVHGRRIVEARCELPTAYKHPPMPDPSEMKAVLIMSASAWGADTVSFPSTHAMTVRACASCGDPVLGGPKLCEDCQIQERMLLHGIRDITQAEIIARYERTERLFQSYLAVTERVRRLEVMREPSFYRWE